MQLSRSILGVLSGRCSGGVLCGALVFGASAPLAQTSQGVSASGSGGALQPACLFRPSHLPRHRCLGGEGVGSGVLPASDVQGRNPNAQDHSGSSNHLTVSRVSFPLKIKSSDALLDLTDDTNSVVADF